MCSESSMSKRPRLRDALVAFGRKVLAISDGSSMARGEQIVEVLPSVDLA